ncbi:4203_t:CDS:2, partial [Diversispora eburnea]
QALVVQNTAGGDNTITGANIISVGVWEENWSIAGGHPALAGTAVVAPNAVQGIKLVQQFASDLWRIVKLAKMTPEQTREQWLRGLSPMNQKIFVKSFQQNLTFDQFKSELEKERSIFKAELLK